MDRLRLSTPHKIIIKAIHFINFMILSKHYSYLAYLNVKKCCSKFFLRYT